MTECNSQIDLFSIGRRTVTASFDDVRLTSDSGVTFLYRIDKRLGLTERLAAAMIDRRDPARVHHTVRDLLMQRIALICAGYEDANDATALRHDPAFQLALGRVPGEAALASQPTLSRFEQRSHRDLLSLSNVLLDLWIERLKRNKSLFMGSHLSSANPAGESTCGSRMHAEFPIRGVSSRRSLRWAGIFPC